MDPWVHMHAARSKFRLLSVYKSNRWQQSLAKLGKVWQSLAKPGNCIWHSSLNIASHTQNGWKHAWHAQQSKSSQWQFSFLFQSRQVYITWRVTVHLIDHLAHLAAHTRYQDRLHRSWPGGQIVFNTIRSRLTRGAQTLAPAKSGMSDGEVATHSTVHQTTAGLLQTRFCATVWHFETAAWPGSLKKRPRNWDARTLEESGPPPLQITGAYLFVRNKTLGDKPFSPQALLLSL